MHKLCFAIPVASTCTLALLVAFGLVDARAQTRLEQPVFPNLDLTVPDVTSRSGAGGTYGRSTIDNSYISSPVEPVASDQGLFIGRSRSGEGRYFVYGESVQRSDERTGQTEEPSRQIGIRVNTRLNSRQGNR